MELENEAITKAESKNQATQFEQTSRKQTRSSIIMGLSAAHLRTSSKRRHIVQGVILEVWKDVVHDAV